MRDSAPFFAAMFRPRPSYRARLLAGGLAVAAATAALAAPLSALVPYALERDIHSHILLVPFISLWLLHLRRPELAREYTAAPGGAGAAVLTAIVALVVGFVLRPLGTVSQNDGLALMALAWVALVTASAFVCLGGAWVRSAAFPLAFLLFAVPLPDLLLQGIERSLQVASAGAAHLLFLVAGVPFERTGMIFQLPEIALRVAPECSGTRSTWVLFMVSLIAGQLFLRLPQHRLALALFIVPLGILRNGFRILVIALLCVEVGPHMVDGLIHRKGGPIFFALSLLPLVGFGLWLWSREHRQRRFIRPNRPVRTNSINLPAQ